MPERVAEPRPATTVACKQPGTASQGHGAPVLEGGTHEGEIRGQTLPRGLVKEGNASSSKTIERNLSGTSMTAC